MIVSSFLSQLLPLLESLPCGAVLLNRAGQVVHVNARACAMMGRGPDELMGRRIEGLYEGDEEARATVAASVADFDTPVEAEFYLPIAGGGRLPVQTAARRLGDSPPYSDLRLITLADISRQKTLEENFKEQYRVIAELSNTILDQAMGLKHSNEDLEERVRQRTRELHEANLDAIFMLAVAAEAKDEDTGRHVRRIEAYAQLLALELGLPSHDCQEIGYSAILHDIGKIHIPDQILKKPGPLTPEERTVCQQHTVLGERILSDKPFFARARRIARWHHENWDGSGYPDQLSGYTMPLEARIVHLADVYDALTSPRVYKAAWSPFDAYAVVVEADGRMFDPDIVRAFRSLWEKNRFDLSMAAPPAGAHAGSAAAVQ
jgi:PAS domain S-box-containing protein